MRRGLIGPIQIQPVYLDVPGALERGPGEFNRMPCPFRSRITSRSQSIAKSTDPDPKDVAELRQLRAMRSEILGIKVEEEHRWILDSYTWAFTQDGYLQTSIDGEMRFLHQVAWREHHGAGAGWPKGEVRHRNGMAKTDARRSAIHFLPGKWLNNMDRGRTCIRTLAPGVVRWKLRIGNRDGATAMFDESARPILEPLSAKRLGMCEAIAQKAYQADPSGYEPPYDACRDAIDRLIADEIVANPDLRKAWRGSNVTTSKIYKAVKRAEARAAAAGGTGCSSTLFESEGFNADEAVAHAEWVVQRLAPIEDKTVASARDLVEALRVLADRRSA